MSGEVRTSTRRQWTAEDDRQRRLTRPQGSQLEQVVSNLHELIALARSLRPALPSLQSLEEDEDREARDRIERLRDEIGGREADRLLLMADGCWGVDDDAALSAMYAKWRRLLKESGLAIGSDEVQA